MDTHCGIDTNSMMAPLDRKKSIEKGIKKIVLFFFLRQETFLFCESINIVLILYLNSIFEKKEIKEILNF